MQIRHQFFIFCLALLVFNPVITTTYAQNNNCDLGGSLGNISSFFVEGLSPESFTADWNSLFSQQNSCHGSDIDNVNSKIKIVQEQIKSNFLSCRNEQIPGLSQRYQELRIERYYLENFIKTANGVSIKTNESELLAAIKERFVNSEKVISELAMNTLWNDLKRRYDNKLSEYNKCNQNNRWQAVSNKWQELVNNLNSLTKSTENPALPKSISANTPANQGASFLDSLVEVKFTNNFEVPSVTATTSGLKTNNQGKVDISELSTKFIDSQDNYAQKISKAEMLAEYQRLYGESTDQSSLAAKNILEQINLKIKEAIPKITALKQCGTKLNAKQCSR